MKAEHIGPIIKLDAELSPKKQNLIFARNGIGKSFIARSLRLFDQSVFSDEQKKEIPGWLVSEESSNGKGSFSLYEGNTCVGSLKLNTQAKSTNITDLKYIFHVFSEDYVNEVLRETRFELDGEITHQIIVGKENAELDEKEAEKIGKTENLNEKKKNLNDIFDTEKEKLKSDFDISGNLKCFNTLNINIFFEKEAFIANPDIESLEILLAQYNKFKSLPSDPQIPIAVDVSTLDLDLLKIEEILAKVTSPSTVVEKFAQKIKSEPGFFEKGLEIYESKSSECPFCTQEMTDIAITAVNAYSTYFNDEEAKERRKLRSSISSIKSAIKVIDGWKSSFLKGKSNFDELKAFFPSFLEKHVIDLISQIEEIGDYLTCLEDCVEKKLSDLTASITMPKANFAILKTGIEENNQLNEKLFKELEKAFNQSSEERKKIQNAACEAFKTKFYDDNKHHIDEIRKLIAEIEKLEAEIEEIRKAHGDKANARDRVAETFSLMLKKLFGEKYSLNKENFQVLRNNEEMRRGGDRTLSDGEKAVMAFCYFIAQIHLRVESNEDYKNVYFIFDDPVTSMSFDYIYSIIQCLKLLRIDNDGNICFDLTSDKHKPKMLILTHNNYFYNVASTNNVVDKNGLFQLFSRTKQHQIRSQKAFATPHFLQLKDVFDVSEGTREPDHTTANSIRSVIEGMWKFCRPDLGMFGDFVAFLVNEQKIEIKSVLINDLSHGGKFDDPPHNEQDIRDAAKEAIEIVRKYAEGQLKGLE